MLRSSRHTRSIRFGTQDTFHPLRLLLWGCQRQLPDADGLLLTEAGQNDFLNSILVEISFCTTTTEFGRCSIMPMPKVFRETAQKESYNMCYDFVHYLTRRGGCNWQQLDVQPHEEVRPQSVVLTKD